MNAEQVRDAMADDRYTFAQDLAEMHGEPRTESQCEQFNGWLYRDLMAYWQEHYPLPRDLLNRCYCAIVDRTGFPLEDVQAALNSAEVE